MKASANSCPTGLLFASNSQDSLWNVLITSTQKGVEAFLSEFRNRLLPSSPDPDLSMTEPKDLKIYKNNEATHYQIAKARHLLQDTRQFRVMSELVEACEYLNSTQHLLIEDFVSTESRVVEVVRDRSVS